MSTQNGFDGKRTPSLQSIPQRLVVPFTEFDTMQFALTRPNLVVRTLLFSHCGHIRETESEDGSSLAVS